MGVVVVFVVVVFIVGVFVVGVFIVVGQHISNTTCKCANVQNYTFLP